MNCLLLLSFILSLATVKGGYNPIPPGSVIISTVNKIIVMKPTEYGGDNSLSTIFTAPSTMTIIHSVYNPIPRDLYIVFANDTSGAVFLCRLVSREQLDSTVYQLAVTFNITNLNTNSMFSSDVANQRIFLTDQYGQIQLFSMSGLMKIEVSQPPAIANQTRFVNNAGALNRLFVVTDTSIQSCSNLDINNLQCCQGTQRFEKLRSIAFDQSSGDLLVYVLEQTTGIYQIILNSAGCPTASRPTNTLGTYNNIYFVIDRGLYFASGSMAPLVDNSLLLIANGTNQPRSILVGASIVALHISNPNTEATFNTEETCFHGITYNDYRTAVILAAVFGTIMGIFMCFNALFCIDFFMTKSIIRELKKQIPHDLLEDRWNKLVEEKYAKIALEKQRQTNDQPPKRVSSVFDRRPAPSATTSNYTSLPASNAPTTTDFVSQAPSSKQKISAYLRRKSDNYFNRRTDEYERQAGSREQDFTSSTLRPPRNQLTLPGAYIEPLQEEDRPQPKGLRQNLSGKELITHDADFL